MALTAIAQELGLHDPRSLSSNFTGALCFVLNAKYLTAFKVLCHSLIATGSFVDRPILIISDEDEVFRDAFVQRVMDVKRDVSEDDKTAFRAVIATKVKDVYRLDWIAKYTFLKWLMYQDYGFDSLVYLDTDMLVTRNLHGFIDGHEEADFICCPMFPLSDTMETIRQDAFLDSIALPFPAPGRMESFLYGFLRGEYALPSERVNSGIQFVGKRLLNDRFRNSLVTLAAARPYPNEQSVLTGFFGRKKRYALRFASPAFNFKSAFIDRVGMNHAFSLLPMIANLHYIGANKPWLKTPTVKTGLSHILWWKAALEVSKRRSTYALPKAELGPLMAAALTSGAIEDAD